MAKTPSALTGRKLSQPVQRQFVAQLGRGAPGNCAHRGPARHPHQSLTTAEAGQPS